MSFSGKSRENCINALQAASGNPDIAYEFLMSGIPTNTQRRAPAQNAFAGA